MLNFRNTNLVFISVLVLLTGFDFYYDIPVLVYIILIFIYSFLVVRGSADISSGFFIPVICKAMTQKKQVAFSFDDGPSAAYTNEILLVLNEYQVKATFFCIGKNIVGNEKLLNQVKNQGHLVGNHSFSHHFWFDLFSSGKMFQDLEEANTAIQKVTGLKPRLFRPPYGVTNPNLKRAISKGNFIPVGWSVRSLDTVVNNPEKLYSNVMRSISPGDIILFHDTCKPTLDVLPRIIKDLFARGYEIVRLDELLKIEAYA